MSPPPGLDATLVPPIDHLHGQEALSGFEHMNGLSATENLQVIDFAEIHHSMECSGGCHAGCPHSSLEADMHADVMFNKPETDTASNINVDFSQAEKDAETLGTSFFDMSHERLTHGDQCPPGCTLHDHGADMLSGVYFRETQAEDVIQDISVSVEHGDHSHDHDQLHDLLEHYEVGHVCDGTCSHSQEQADIFVQTAFEHVAEHNEQINQVEIQQHLSEAEIIQQFERQFDDAVQITRQAEQAEFAVTVSTEVEGEGSKGESENTSKVSVAASGLGTKSVQATPPAKEKLAPVAQIASVYAAAKEKVSSVTNAVTERVKQIEQPAAIEAEQPTKTDKKVTRTSQPARAIASKQAAKAPIKKNQSAASIPLAVVASETPYPSTINTSEAAPSADSADLLTQDSSEVADTSPLFEAQTTAVEALPSAETVDVSEFVLPTPELSPPDTSSEGARLDIAPGAAETSFDSASRFEEAPVASEAVINFEAPANEASQSVSAEQTQQWAESIFSDETIDELLELDFMQVEIGETESTKELASEQTPLTMFEEGEYVYLAQNSDIESDLSRSIEPGAAELKDSSVEQSIQKLVEQLHVLNSEGLNEVQEERIVALFTKVEAMRLQGAGETQIAAVVLREAVRLLSDSGVENPELILKNYLRVHGRTFMVHLVRALKEIEQNVYIEQHGVIQGMVGQQDDTNEPLVTVVGRLLLSLLHSTQGLLANKAT